MTKENIILTDNLPRNYHGGFILIKPSSDFYKKGTDYLITDNQSKEIKSKARLVEKRTFPIYELSDLFTVLCSDLRASDFTRIYKQTSTDHRRTVDVLIFSANSFYNDWYKEKTKDAVVMRQKEIEQVKLF